MANITLARLSTAQLLGSTTLHHSFTTPRTSTDPTPSPRLAFRLGVFEVGYVSMPLQRSNEVRKVHIRTVQTLNWFAKIVSTGQSAFGITSTDALKESHTGVSTYLSRGIPLKDVKSRVQQEI